MPFPVAAAVAGGAALVGQGINAAATASMNKKTRQWNEKRYDIERANALTDWNMQNQYNSPSAVMARYQEAGLNPNLIYGNGTSASAQAVQQPHANPYRPSAPQFDLQAPVDGYFNTQSSMAQLSNQQKQGDILDAQKRLMDADIVAKLFSNQYNAKTEHIRRATDAGRANLIGTQYAQADQNLELNRSLEAIRLATAGATLKSILSDNLLKDQRYDLGKQDYSFNTYRNQMAAKSAENSAMGMKPQDWLKLILGGVQSVTPFLPKKR